MNGLEKDYTYVLLIGTSKYPNWQVMDIPNIQVNLKELQLLLTDEFYCGIPKERIIVIQDQNLEDTNTAIQEFFDNIQTPKSTVILYYSGHGLQSVKAMDDLFLATRNIREKAFEASSIKISELRRLFSDCIASRKILLLDCCYAGKIAKGFMSPDSSDNIAKFNDFEGTYIMAASSEYERARFDPDDPNSPTKFTGKFIDVIKHGIDGDDEYCTLNSIYNQIRNAFLIQKDAPRPVQIGQDNIGSFPIFRNKKFAERVAEDESEWNKISNSNSINAYNKFITEFPDSKYRKEAVIKIKDIEDEGAWRKACNKNTIGGYWEYISNYENNKEEAQKRLHHLSSMEQEHEEWTNAVGENKASLFEEYCKNYPDGRYINEARQRIEALKEARAAGPKPKNIFILFFLRYWKTIITAVIAIIVCIKLVNNIYNAPPHYFHDPKDSTAATNLSIINPPNPDTPRDAKPPNEQPMSADLLDTIKAFSNATNPRYYSFFDHIFTRIELAPKSQQESLYVKEFIKKYQIAKAKANAKLKSEN